MDVTNKLLEKQLKRAGFSSEALPNDLNNWQDLLNKVANAYSEHDQERYLNERSIEISSREMIDLNQRLEHAQEIAKLGYWICDSKNKEMLLSKEIYNMLQLDNEKNYNSPRTLLKFIHKDDRKILLNNIKQARKDNKEFSQEVRVNSQSGEYRWLVIIGQINVQQNKISGILMDIDQRKQAEIELDKMHQELVVTARLAGITEIASSVLHNVGNILNSVNVSLNLIQENMQTTLLDKYFAAVELLKQHESEPDFFLEHPKGKLIPKFLIALSEGLHKERDFFVREINNLNSSIQHIKEIVSMQQVNCRTVGLAEKVFLPEISDAAVKMCISGVNADKIRVERIYEEVPFVTTDKSKLLQILVNLIKNAKEAVLQDEHNTEKSIKIYLRKKTEDPNLIQIRVQDNGIGIDKNDFIKIFSFGFTKKTQGHGIGLHSSALSAKELGAKLEVDSEGVGRGAAFILTIPIAAAIAQEGG